MNKILEIIESHSEKEVTDFHFHANENPFLRKFLSIEIIENENIITENDLLDFFNEHCDNKSKVDELKSNGSCDFGFRIKDKGNFRANFYYQQKKISAAIRKLPATIPEFDSLHLSPYLKNVINQKSGLVLVTGLTGNGKSTTIASLINEINKNYKKHIITIEDPIEYVYSEGQCLISQREVGFDCPSFEEGLRSALRQDPDVILIGEMRDKKTISVALEAAESGHLVFSTLHTSSVATSMDRIMSYFESEEQSYLRSKLASSLKAIFCQKLIPCSKNNSYCVATEIMFNNNAIKTLIRDGKPYQISSFLQINKEQGMMTMEESLAILYKNGSISLETAKENSNDENQLELMIKKLQ